MSEKEPMRILPEEIASMIRDQIYRRKHDRSCIASQSRVHHSSSAADIRTFISLAEHNSDAGACVTPMEQFNGITRKLALFIGKLVVYLVSFITDKQRKCNKGIILALRTIADGMESLHSVSVSSAQELTMLRQEIEQLKENMALMSKTAVEESNATATKLHGIHVAVLEQEKRLTHILEEGQKETA